MRLGVVIKPAVVDWKESVEIYSLGEPDSPFSVLTTVELKTIWGTTL